MWVVWLASNYFLEFTEDGWLRTADAGYIDKNGYLHFLVRMDDMINMQNIKKKRDTYLGHNSQMVRNPFLFNGIII